MSVRWHQRPTYEQGIITIGITMTSQDPGFAAALRVARRALAERLALLASDERARIGNAVGPVTVPEAARETTSLLPVPPKDNHSGP